MRRKLNNSRSKKKRLKEINLIKKHPLKTLILFYKTSIQYKNKL